MALSVTSAIWQQINSPAVDIRRFHSAGKQEGVVAAGDMAVAQRASGANFSVDIAAGEALVLGDTVTNQALYYVYNDAVTNVATFSAANATNPRIDRVTLRVRDAFHGDAANDVSFQVVAGTPTSGATLANLNGAASVPGSSLLLANVLIPATATTITTGNIDTTVRSRILSVSQISPGTNGQVLTTSGGVAAWGSSTSYVTSLPGSPADAQEAILVDSTTSPTYQWRFRYNAGSSSTYKWEYVGGAPAENVVTTQESSSSTTYVDLATTGPSFTVPRAGEYLIWVGAGQAFWSAGTLAVQYMTVKLGAAAAADTEAFLATGPAVNSPLSGGRWYKRTLAASDVLKAMYRGANGATTYKWQDRELIVLPVRVS